MRRKQSGKQTVYSLYTETKEEKLQFIYEIFQLDANEILKADEKLKEAVIKLF